VALECAIGAERSPAATVHIVTLVGACHENSTADLLYFDRKIPVVTQRRSLGW
jgi:hypothetical protein